MSEWNQQKFNDVVSAITNAANQIKNSNAGSYIVVPLSKIHDDNIPMQCSLEMEDGVLNDYAKQLSDEIDKDILSRMIMDIDECRPMNITLEENE